MAKIPYPISYKPLTECPHCDSDLIEVSRALKKKYVKIVYYCLRCGRRSMGRSERFHDINSARVAAGLRPLNELKHQPKWFKDKIKYRQKRT